jgi:hypothetical protein
VRFPYQGRYSPATRPDTFVTMATTTTTTTTGSKTVHLLIGAVQDQAPFGCFVLRLGVFRASFGFLSEEGFPPGRPMAPSGPSLGPGRLRSLCGAVGVLCFFPFLAWSWIPPHSADFGTCPGNHLASIFQVCPFAIIQWGLLHLLGESAPAPEVAGWTTVIVHVAMHLLEMRPIKYVLSGGLLILFSLQLLHLRLYRSVALLQGGSPALSHEEGIVCPLGANGVDASSGRLPTPAAFSMQSLSFSQEAFRVFRPED